MDIKLDWFSVLQELHSLKESSFDLDKLQGLTLDTLHGSMYGLNYRYMSLETIFENESDKNAIISYSIKRIKQLIDTPAFTYKKRPLERCLVGVGTYRWNYDESIINNALDWGVSMIDTAEGYGYGKVEKKLGEILLEHSGEAQVFTKIRRDHMSPQAITNAVYRSMDHLCIKPHVQLHYPNDKHPDAVLNLADFKNKDLIKSIGLGNCSIDMIEQAQQTLSNTSGVVINSVQLPFSLLNRQSKLAIEYCTQRGILIIAYSPLGQDFHKLNTKYLQKVAKKYDATPAQIALSWVLSHPGVLPIPQTNNVSHLRENIEANELYLEDEDFINLQNYYESLN